MRLSPASTLGMVSGPPDEARLDRAHTRPAPGRHQRRGCRRGIIDLELRSQGFIPHRFTDVKRWSITPTIRNNDPRLPFNQLLEADIV
jgi:hypothetical protein